MYEAPLFVHNDRIIHRKNGIQIHQFLTVIMQLDQKIAPSQSIGSISLSPTIELSLSELKKKSLVESVSSTAQILT